MGIFNFGKKPKETKGLNPNTVKITDILGLLTPLPQTYKEATAYETMSAVYTVVTYLMQKFASVPVRVYKVKDKMALKAYKNFEPQMFNRPSNYIKGRRLFTKALDQADENSDLARLLQQPNPVMDSDTFLMTLFGFHLLRGEGFLWGNRGELSEGNPKAPILELYPLPPQFMFLVPDPDDVWGIKQWVIQLPKFRVLPVEDVQLWRMPRFDFDSTTHIHLRGQSPLTAGKTDLEGIAALDQAFKSTYLNKGAGGIIATSDPDLSFSEMTKQLKEINERMVGTDNTGAIRGFNGVSPQFFNTSMSAQDLALIEGKKYSTTQVAQLYNAPGGIWDLSESANNNITQYRAQVFTDVIMGKWCTLCNILNSWLLPAFNMQNGSYIACDYSEVPDLQADMERMLSNYKDEWRITPNEWREMTGWDPNPNPLMDEIWVKAGLKPIDDAALNIDDLPEDPEDEPTKKPTK